MPRRYPVAFRRKVLDLIAAGNPVAEIAAQLGITAQTVYNWRNQDQIDRGLRVGVSTSESAELAAARKRIGMLSPCARANRLPLALVGVCPSSHPACVLAAAQHVVPSRRASRNRGESLEHDVDEARQLASLSSTNPIPRSSSEVDLPIPGRPPTRHSLWSLMPSQWRRSRSSAHAPLSERARALLDGQVLRQGMRGLRRAGHWRRCGHRDGPGRAIGRLLRRAARQSSRAEPVCSRIAGTMVSSRLDRRRARRPGSAEVLCLGSPPPSPQRARAGTSDPP